MSSTTLQYRRQYLITMAPPTGKSAAQKKEEETLAKYLDHIMASEAGRLLVTERAQGLGVANAPSGASSTSPELAQMQAALASLADTVKALASTAMAAKRPRSASPVPGSSSAPDPEQPQRSKDDPLPPPLQRPFGKGAYARSSDPLFSSEGKQSISAAIPVLCVMLDVECTPSIL